MPNLTEAEVERFVALGKEGRDRFRAGDLAGAEAAFRGQLSIFGGNPEPFVSLALHAAARGSKKTAVKYMRDAVVRGFTDLLRIDRAEVWIPLLRDPEYRELHGALQRLVDYEREWAMDWSSFQAGRAPRDLDAVLREHRRAVAGIEPMAPALGPRYTRLAKILFDRVAASRLEAYVTQKPQAPDLADALDHLMALYAGGPLLRWGPLPAESARRLAAVSSLVLERFPESSMRPNALVGLALARYAERDKRGRLQQDAASRIGAGLNEVLTRYPDSAVAATAAVGLIRSEVQVGRSDRAAMRYRQLREGRAGDPVLERVREELGVLALWLGGLPEFHARALDGRTVGADALRGKVAVLDFWATWCQPCVDEFPTLQRIRERHGDEVLLLGINLDSADDIGVEDLGQWIASQGVPGSHLHDGLSWDSELVKSFGVREIPFNVVVGADGTILAINEHGKRLEKTVNAAVRNGSEGRQQAR